METGAGPGFSSCSSSWAFPQKGVYYPNRNISLSLSLFPSVFPMTAFLRRHGASFSTGIHAQQAYVRYRQMRISPLFSQMAQVSTDASTVIYLVWGGGTRIYLMQCNNLPKVTTYPHGFLRNADGCHISSLRPPNRPTTHRVHQRGLDQKMVPNASVASKPSLSCKHESNAYTSPEICAREKTVRR